MNDANGAAGHSRGIALIADDDRVSRMTLGALLQRLDFEVAYAENGVQAVEAFLARRFDVVFMDVVMPEMDGREAAKRIKAAAGLDFVPMIFVTATHEDDEIESCVAAGGDDFLMKPFRPAVLTARVKAMERIRSLHRRASDLSARLQDEQVIAEKVFSRVVSADNVSPPALLAAITPAGTFSGDLLLTAYAPHGDLHVLLGDFTGHGLAAALGAMPTAEIFRSMTRKGFAPAHILGELNRKLHGLLPTGSFLAALFVCVPETLDHIVVANCGMPEALLVGVEGAIRAEIRSDALPLGIAAESPVEAAFHLVPTAAGERVVLASDGVFEACNPAGTPFGRQRLDDAIGTGGSPFAAIRNALDAFRDGAEALDDISLVEVGLTPGLFQEWKWPASLTRRCDVPQRQWQSASRLTLELRGDALRRADPVPLIVSQMQDVVDLGEHRSVLWTIFSELYANALDHGVLGLDSALKRDADGVQGYYSERERRLQHLGDGWVRVTAELQPGAGGCSVSILVEDSGPGFDWKAARPAATEGLHGRGLQLIARLCDALVFDGAGNRVQARYVWRCE
jgi:CheY-like chemotaxis protein